MITKTHNFFTIKNEVIMKTQKIIRFDWAIKTLLRDNANFDVLEGFLSALFNDDITVVQLIESESNQDDQTQKFNRVDIMVLDSQHQHFIIEIQNESESDYLERLLFGTSKVIVENAKLGTSFKDISKVISISILYFNMGRGDDYIYYGSTQFRGIHTNNPLRIRKKIKTSEKKYILKDRNIEKEIFPEYYLIHVERFKNQINSDIDEWIYMLKNECIPENFKSKNIEKAREKLNIQQMSDQQRKNYERYLINVVREKDIIETARDEGKEEGHKEGKEEGFKEGKEEGLMEGEIVSYQNILKNTSLPQYMIHDIEAKIVDLQNKLQEIKRV